MDQMPFYGGEECYDMYEHVILLGSYRKAGFEQEASSGKEFNRCINDINKGLNMVVTCSPNKVEGRKGRRKKEKSIMIFIIQTRIRQM